MIVLVTGANGLVGSALCREGARQGHTVAALVRPGADRTLLPADAFPVEGDFTSAADADRVLEETQAEAIIHAAAVISTGTPDLDESWRVNVEGTRTLCEAAQRAGIRRWLQVSSMSAHPANKSVYGATKLAADEVLRASPLRTTIFRPSLVYGPQRRGIFHKLVTLLNRLPAIPVVGSGKEPMRPVHVDDLAAAFFQALEVGKTQGRTYCLGGPEDWTFRDVLAAIARGLGKNPVLLPVPLPLCRMMAVAGETLLPDPPLTTDNLEGIAKAEAINSEKARRDIGFAPRPFAEGFAKCLEEGLLSAGKGQKS